VSVSLLSQALGLHSGLLLNYLGPRGRPLAFSTSLIIVGDPAMARMGWERWALLFGRRLLSTRAQELLEVLGVPAGRVACHPDAREEGSPHPNTLASLHPRSHLPGPEGQKPTGPLPVH
jgi:hypothetical protein